MVPQWQSQSTEKTFQSLPTSVSFRQRLEQYHSMIASGVFSLLLAVLCTQGATAEHVILCDGDTLSVSCHDDSVIVFESANYGRTNASVCVPTEASDTSCLTPATLSVLNRRCFGQADCTVEVNGAVFTDACPEVAKYLEADYACIKRSSIFPMSSENHITRVSGETVGYVTSPGYPNKYEADEDCLVVVTPQQGRRIDTTVLDMDVEARQTVGCYDKLIVQDDMDVSKTYDYCGTLDDLHTGEPTEARQIELLVIKFWSDAVSNRGGFIVKFQEVEYEPPETEREEL